MIKNKSQKPADPSNYLPSASPKGGQIWRIKMQHTWSVWISDEQMIFSKCNYVQCDILANLTLKIYSLFNWNVSWPNVLCFIWHLYQYQPPKGPFVAFCCFVLGERDDGITRLKKKIWKPSVCSPTKHFGLHGIEITQNRISTEYPSLLFKELSSLALNKAQEGGETFVAGCSWANWSNKGSIQLTLCISHTHTETSANSIEKAETVRKFHLANLVIMKFDFRFLLLERDGEKTPAEKEREEKVENLHNRIYSFSNPEDQRTKERQMDGGHARQDGGCQDGVFYRILGIWSCACNTEAFNHECSVSKLCLTLRPHGQ